jgi:hypothetical protein
MSQSFAHATFTDIWWYRQFEVMRNASSSHSLTMRISEGMFMVKKSSQRPKGFFRMIPCSSQRPALTKLTDTLVAADVPEKINLGLAQSSSK